MDAREPEDETLARYLLGAAEPQDAELSLARSFAQSARIELSLMSPTLRRLDGRVAAVTGAGGEIGRGICSELAREGASIAALDLDRKAALETAHEVVRQFKVKATAIRMDVTLGRSIQTAVKRITEELGATEILVNNAGVLTLSPLLELPEKEWDFVMNVNAKGCSSAPRFLPGRWSGGR